MPKTKKVVLFIVEGITDEVALEGIMEKLINNAETKFYLTDGDITSSNDYNSANIRQNLSSIISKFRSRYSFRKSDINKIIHIVDTDGAYISEECIEEAEVDEWIYSLDKIKAKCKDLVKKRNYKKSALMNLLSSTDKISSIDYKVYYFSSNLEHVLHDKINVPNDEKMDLADRFENNYKGRESDFIEFISNPSIVVHGSYKDTWEHIKKDNNSLKRFSNFHLFFQ